VTIITLIPLPQFYFADLNILAMQHQHQIVIIGGGNAGISLLLQPNIIITQPGRW
jgi:hypothetical protein